MRIKILPLDTSVHDRGAFSCGHLSVDEYLRKAAAQAQKYFKAATFVLCSPEAPSDIMGFYTLAQHAYVDDQLDPLTARALKVNGLHHIPMILLAQLGVSSTFQGQGLGKLLIGDSLERSLNVALDIGGAALITDPVDANAARFYAKFSFTTLQETPFHRMILPMRTIRAALGSAGSVP